MYIYLLSVICCKPTWIRVGSLDLELDDCAIVYSIRINPEFFF